MSKNISFHLDAETGELNISFKLPVPHCKYDSFELSLYLHKNDSENCTNLHELSMESETEEIPKKHSERIYHTHSSKPNRTSAACQEYAQVTFLHIYTGCYYVVITPNMSGTKRRLVESIPHFLETQIKKSDVELLRQNTSVTVSQTSQSQEYRLKFSLILPHGSTGPKQMVMQLRNNIDKKSELHCTATGDEVNCCTMRKGLREAVCRKTEEKGCYYHLSAVDDRCDREVWSHSSEVQESAPNGQVQLPSTRTNRWPVWVVLGLVVTATFIALLYGLYVLLTIARQRPDQQNLPLEESPTNPLINNQEQKILLLYARDCAPFMELMLGFRELLQKYCNCEVLDCYDEDNQQEIFTREHDWLLGQMNHVPMTDLKVVLVATECSAAHQLAQLGSRSVVEYRDPDPCDKIFPLALKLLKEDVNPGLYTRVKLVEFSGFKITNENLTLFPTPFVRYTLPHGFKDLICSLCQLASTDQLNVCDDDIKGISTRLDDLLQYKKDNPLYLQTIIT
ncbi:hypothetical protein B566_EDAN005416 [Ephemera danica]|nr:hypothetical protein B566_EDAN005416 [Ephemera danica]